MIEYASHSEAGIRFPFLLLSRHLGEFSSDDLAIYIAPDWWRKVSQEHVGYLQGLIGDWRHMDLEERDRLYRQLSEASIGPLRFCASGTCSPMDRSRVAAYFFHGGSKQT